MISRVFISADLIDQRDFDTIIKRRRQIADEMRRVAKAAEAELPDDQRRGCYLPGEDPVELTPSLMAAGGTLELTATPTDWERTKWVAAFLMTGLAMGAIATAIVDCVLR